MICKICGNKFEQNIRAPKQKVCSKKKCKRERQRRVATKWRKDNPNYIKEYHNNAKNVKPVVKHKQVPQYGTAVVYFRYLKDSILRNKEPYINGKIKE